MHVYFLCLLGIVLSYCYYCQDIEKRADLNRSQCLDERATRPVFTHVPSPPSPPKEQSQPSKTIMLGPLSTNPAVSAPKPKMYNPPFSVPSGRVLSPRVSMQNNFPSSSGRVTPLHLLSKKKSIDSGVEVPSFLKTSSGQNLPRLPDGRSNHYSAFSTPHSATFPQTFNLNNFDPGRSRKINQLFPQFSTLPLLTQPTEQKKESSTKEKNDETQSPLPPSSPSPRRKKEILETSRPLPRRSSYQPPLPTAVCLHDQRYTVSDWIPLAAMLGICFTCSHALIIKSGILSDIEIPFLPSLFSQIEAESFVDDISIDILATFVFLSLTAILVFYVIE